MLVFFYVFAFFVFCARIDESIQSFNRSVVMIHLHPKYGLNPTTTRCFFCNETKDVRLIGAAVKPFKEAGLCSSDGEMNHDIGVVDMEPCDKCKEYMKQGIIMVSIRDGDEEFNMQNPYRTGGWIVIKEEAVERMGLPPETSENILRTRFAFVPDTTWDMFGLPREPIAVNS
jgi:hypothetical protein